MANVKFIERVGDQLSIAFDDNTRKLAVPTNTDRWIISAGGGGGPAPGGERFIWPFPLTEVTSEWGPRSGRLHAGIDFGRGASNVAKTPVKCSAAGTVHLARPYGGYGNCVIVNHGGGLFTLYGHFFDGTTAVSEGQPVTQGQVLGGIGQTGNSFGLHLHFETHEDGYRGDRSSRNPRLFIPKYNGS